jgi:hypothetical protein
MHKLILSFKGRILKVVLPTTSECTVGSDPGCDITIDNLGVEPVQAIIHIQDEIARLEIKDSDKVTLYNHQPITSVESPILQNGDEITLGKFKLNYRWEQSQASEATPLDSSTLNKPISGWLQMMNGPRMGRTFQINQPKLKIGNASDPAALISTREGGYYLTHLGDKHRVKLNDVMIGDDGMALHDGYLILVDETELLFYLQESETG